MDKERVTAYFKSEYPGRNILSLPEGAEEPMEIICEIEPTSVNPERSVAIVAIEKSNPHIHSKSIETYEVLEGTVRLFVGISDIDLAEGDSFQIQPGTVHWAVGDGEGTIVKVTSVPGWREEDHILAPWTERVSE